MNLLLRGDNVPKLVIEPSLVHFDRVFDRVHWEGLASLRIKAWERPKNLGEIWHEQAWAKANRRWWFHGRGNKDSRLWLHFDLVEIYWKRKVLAVDDSLSLVFHLSLIGVCLNVYIITVSLIISILLILEHSCVPVGIYLKLIHGLVKTRDELHAIGGSTKVNKWLSDSGWTNLKWLPISAIVDIHDSICIILVIRKPDTADLLDVERPSVDALNLILRVGRHLCQDSVHIGG